MPPAPRRFPLPRGQVQTVNGLVSFESLGITDAHNHVWIDKILGSDPSSPVLSNKATINQELTDYRQTGGSAILDCQPGCCGRDGNVLRELSISSGVAIIACTGFHRRKYYAPDHWLWSSHDSQHVADYLTGELTLSLEETRLDPQPVLAGFIKIALEATLAGVPKALLEGVAAAASLSGAALELHTEKGEQAVEAVHFFQSHGVPAFQLILCHMDKRPDFGLHAELAKQGVLLEYDTFYRPKYQPELRLWPLIHQMVSAGLSKSVALATDMAEVELYAHPSSGPGLASLPGEIQNRLQREGLASDEISHLLGGNILRRLARLS